METYVLSLIGTDRAGLVSALAEVVVDNGGSWEQSHVTELAGIFAGVVLVRLPSGHADGFERALAPLREQGMLEVSLRPAPTDVPSVDAPTVRFEVTGADRPGIVHEVSGRLASLGVGIVDLQTRTESAAMDGAQLFRAVAVVRLSEGTSRWDVVAALEDLSGDLVVDIAED